MSRLERGSIKSGDKLMKALKTNQAVRFILFMRGKVYGQTKRRGEGRREIRRKTEGRRVEGSIEVREEFETRDKDFWEETKVR